MSFDEFTERTAPRIADASVQLRVRACSRPALIIGLLKSFTESVIMPFKAGDGVDVLVGKDESAGKLRLRKAKGKGVGVIRAVRTSGMATDCGFISALGLEARPKVRTTARVIDDCVEIDLPDDLEWSCAGSDESEVEEEEQEAEEEVQAPQPARALVAKPRPAASLPALNLHGITIEFDTDAERISYGSKFTEVTPRQAQLVGHLLRAFPNPVGREFLQEKLFGKTGTAIDVQLDMVARDLVKALPAISLELKITKGVGLSLAKRP
jgi:hypothetical protein